MLVRLWQESNNALKSTRSYKIWAKIKTAVDYLGPTKTTEYCKDKMQDLKYARKRAKENSNK